MKRNRLLAPARLETLERRTDEAMSIGTYGLCPAKTEAIGFDLIGSKATIHIADRYLGRKSQQELRQKDHPDLRPIICAWLAERTTKYAQNLSPIFSGFFWLVSCIDPNSG
ncbi:hypothetical protein PGTUg99_033045 [Puccinia graminis f. sp. tritici]|uniref:Uncharacterized protein n=1 Tax=Puccinia graminis f. sp. tritici TaxID=56615 RepID=A0A5B0MIV1_PUCGR|nr:hypothetical protein PGTUg99_033045 [Puccinia graminis f. sp. tritici]